MIEIYCGDGKGKTTAAVGISVRAAGHDIPVLFAQFMKGSSPGEITILKSLPQVQVFHAEVFYGFTKHMNQQQKEEMKQQYTGMIKLLEHKIMAAKGSLVLVVLDEIIHACNQNLLEEELLYQFLDRCPDAAEIVLTGREPSSALLERADYVSQIHKIKHPYDRGILARKGIEL